MSKWIHRAAALAVLGLYVLVGPGPRTFVFGGWAGWWFLTVFGLVVIWLADWLDENFGPSSSASFVPIVLLMGWAFLIIPIAWSLYVWFVTRG